MILIITEARKYVDDSFTPYMRRRDKDVIGAHSPEEGMRLWNGNADIEAVVVSAFGARADEFHPQIASLLNFIRDEARQRPAAPLLIGTSLDLSHEEHFAAHGFVFTDTRQLKNLLSERLRLKHPIGKTLSEAASASA
ncbi:MAG: hypothetical protein V1821_02520 [bacterium]